MLVPWQFPCEGELRVRSYQLDTRPIGPDGSQGIVLSNQR